MRITAVHAAPLEAPLVDPFLIANARLDRVHNVHVRVTVEGGHVGHGEVATLVPLTAESQKDAERAIARATDGLLGVDASDADALTDRLLALIPDFAATRAGVEEACWDAAARAAGAPLWRRFGEVAHPVVTDVTLPIVDVERARVLAATWRDKGFQTLKVKVGGGLHDDLQRIAAVLEGHPRAGLVLDANEGWSVSDALSAVRAVRRLGGRIVLLEQPVPREDLDALARLTRDAGVVVCADEAVRTVEDVDRIGKERLASAINVKLAKSGVAGVVALVRAARAHGLQVMIGAMVETRIGTGFGAHLAAGLGGFVNVDLDTSLLLAQDPVRGGTALDGPRWDVSAVATGHGPFPE
jgi:L-alanine-DL-glutamate epimerase-like enolase superfamily enzyme